MHCFYAPQLLSLGSDALSEDEWRHIKALRIKSGECICLVDGSGHAQEYIFQLQDKKPFLEVLTAVTFHEKERGVQLYIPMTQQADRIEWMLEKCVEMGLLGLNLITTQHSEKVKYSIDRLNRIAVSAMKQSQRKWLPKIKIVEIWDEVLNDLKGKEVFIAHCETSQKKNWLDCEAMVPHVLIGPEGDFSEKEIHDILSLGGVPISLGNARLRTETAGLLVVSKYCLL